MYLSGAIYNPSSSSFSDAFAVLPRTARSAHALEITVAGAPALTGDNSDGFVYIYSSGELIANMESGDPSSFTFLSGVSYLHGS